MPKRRQTQNRKYRKSKTHKSKTRKSNTHKSRTRKSNMKNRYKIRGGCASVSCQNSGSVDHTPPQWNSTSTITGGSHDINDELYNQYTDVSPYSSS